MQQRVIVIYRPSSTRFKLFKRGIMVLYILGNEP